MDFKVKVCRACLLEDDSMEYLSLHGHVTDFEKELTYLECFEQCTQLTLNIKGSNFLQADHLCLCCEEDLRSAYKFIKRAHESDRKLRLKLSASAEQSEIFEWVAVPKQEENSCSAESFLSKQLTLPETETFPSEDDRDFKPDLSAVEAQLTSNLQETSKLDEPEEFLESSMSEISYSSCNDEEYTPPVVKSLPIKGCTKKKRGRPEKNVLGDIKKNSSKKLSERKILESTCEYCGKLLPYKQLKRHLLLEHQHRTLLCQACPKTFRKICTLREHERIHEKNRERNFVCDQCGKKFYTPRAYKNHIKTHDHYRKALFHCDICGKSFMHKGSLTSHKLKHDEPKIVCNICQKRYVRFVDFEVHLRSHSGDLPYKCSKCDKAFIQSSSLYRHMRQHEGFRYKCDICGKDYEHQSTLKHHQASHTGLPLKCGICGRGFATKYRITRHIGMVHKIKDDMEIAKLIMRDTSKNQTAVLTAETT